jgi:hypothetical protein
MNPGNKVPSGIDPIDGGKWVRINHVTPEDIRTIYANNVVVQFTSQRDCFICFFEITPPILLGDAPDADEKLSQIESTDAKCVARIAIPATIVPGVIAAMAENYQKITTQDQSKKEEEDPKKDRKHAV